MDYPHVRAESKSRDIVQPMKPLTDISNQVKMNAPFFENCRHLEIFLQRIRCISLVRGRNAATAVTLLITPLLVSHARAHARTQARTHGLSLGIHTWQTTSDILTGLINK